MIYCGQMRTSLLTDRKICPTEFRRWDDAVRKFSRGRDRDKIDELKESIARRGLLTPIVLGVSGRHPDVYVADGHHRSIALMELRVREFPFHWYWIKNFGVHMERNPFPYRLLED